MNALLLLYLPLFCGCVSVGSTNSNRYGDYQKPSYSGYRSYGQFGDSKTKQDSSYGSYQPPAPPKTSYGKPREPYKKRTTPAADYYKPPTTAVYRPSPYYKSPPPHRGSETAAYDSYYQPKQPLKPRYVSYNNGYHYYPYRHINTYQKGPTYIYKPLDSKPVHTNAHYGGYD